MPKITLENGKEVNISQESYDELEKAVSKLPDSWEDIEGIKGHFVDDESDLIEIENFFNPTYTCRNVWATRELAEASIAMAQLSQLRKIAWDGWKPDWTDGESKHNICVSSNNIRKLAAFFNNYFLAFETREIRDEFLEKYRSLIEIAKPLL